MGDGKSDVSFDGKGFLELYDAWKTKASDISAADLGMQMSTDNLYAVLHKHGVMGRIMGNSGPENVPGIGKELDALEKMANNPQFTKEEIADLQQLVNILNTHGAELGDLNPRNIRFDGIGKINRRKRTASKKRCLDIIELNNLLDLEHDIRINKNFQQYRLSGIIRVKE